MKAFDEKLAKLGYQANSSGKTKKSHHKGPGQKPPAKASAESPAKLKGKA